MLNKINVLPIIADHVKTFHAARRDRILKRDIVLFYVFPALCAVVLVIAGARVPTEYVDYCLLVHTILIPLIVNVLFVIYSIRERPRMENAGEDEAKRQEKARFLLEDIYKNLSYAIIISFASVVALGATKFIGLPPLFPVKQVFLNWFNILATNIIYGVVYFLMVHIVLTGLMIIKRTHVLLTEFSR